MDAMEAILTRRSIRKFTDREIADELIRKILEAAMHAPSAGNQQPWHFVVIRDRAIRERVPEFHPHAAMIVHSPVAILVCADKTLEKYPGTWMLDCSAATENMLLAAHALGLGAVWLGIHGRPERVAGLRKLLGLPGHVEPLALAAVGYSGEVKERPERFKPDRVHSNRW